MNFHNQKRLAEFVGLAGSLEVYLEAQSLARKDARNAHVPDWRPLSREQLTQAITTIKERVKAKTAA